MCYTVVVVLGVPKPAAECTLSHNAVCTNVMAVHYDWVMRCRYDKLTVMSISRRDFAIPLLPWVAFYCIPCI